MDTSFNTSFETLITETSEVFWRDQPTITVSEWAATKRVMPSDSPFPGPWRNELTPYLVEIMDNMSAYSGVIRDITAKGTQLGLTAAAENVAGYWMDAFPTKILFVSATDELLKTWVATRFEKMVDSCDLRRKIYSQSESRGHKKTGDRMFLKEFLGGFIRFTSSNSAPGLRNVDARLLVRDEISGYPRELSTGEGSPLAVSMARTDAWGDRKKIMDFSTPGDIDRCLLWPEYELGDQRKFFIPCPHCGEMQVLEWGHGFGHENPNHGVHWEIKDGQVKQAWYVCKFCETQIKNHEKRIMLQSGKWKPTATSYSEVVQSHHISSLYSPPGMLEWRTLAEEFLDAQEKGPAGMRSFVNTRLALQYRETGARPDWTKVIELRGDYRSGTVPKGVIFLTASVDVQRGQEREDGRPARLEMEVCGHGIGYRTWSIEHKVFEGSTENEHEGAWADLSEYWRETMMTYQRADGARFQIKMAYVDSGDNTHTVYAFCGMWQGVIPSKGMATVKRRKDEPLDEDMNRSIRRFRIANLEGGQILAEINGPFYKKQVYTNLKIPRNYNSPVQQANFCDFPIDYGEDYYKQLTAEEMIQEPDGNISFKKSSARPNEALDCFDDKTEVLTDKGWRRFCELKKTEKVATVKLPDETIEFQKPLEYIEREHSGEMIHILGRRIDIMVTENHRMVATKKRWKKQNDGKYKWDLNQPMEVVLAKDLTIHHQLLMAAKWKKKSHSKKIIPAWKTVYGHIKWPEVKVNAGDLAEFLGWFVSEGSAQTVKTKGFPNSRACRIQIDQNPGPKSDKIEGLLKRLPWNFRKELINKRCNRWNFHSSQLFEIVKECGLGAENKRVPQWIKDSSPKIISRFLESAVLGDGWQQETSQSIYFRSYATVSRQLADDIQELFIKIGNAANIKEHEPKNNKCRKQYHVTELRSRKASLDGGGNRKRIFIGKRVFYTGKVYCVSVPNGTLICRRNGRSFVAGNCRVMNLCARDHYLDQIVQYMKADAKNRGYTAAALEGINSRTALEWMDSLIKTQK